MTTENLTSSVYELVLIHTNLSIPNVCQSILDVTGLKPCQTRRIYNRDGFATNRIIAVMTSDLFEELQNKGYSTEGDADFSVSLYKIYDSDLPKDNCETNLYVPIPSEIKEEDAREKIAKGLSRVSDWGFIPKNGFEVVDFNGRDKLRGLRIVFKDNVIGRNAIPIENKAMVRLILDDHDWDKKGDYKIRCQWGHKQKEVKGNKRVYYSVN